MKRNLILVADMSDTQLAFFENIFGNSNFDVRCVNTPLQAAVLRKALWFTHVFIGDMPDISWMGLKGGTNMTILYSMNQALVAQQRQLLDIYEIVPFLGMRNYLFNNGFLADAAPKIKHAEFINLDSK